MNPDFENIDNSSGQALFGVINIWISSFICVTKKDYQRKFPLKKELFYQKRKKAYYVEIYLYNCTQVGTQFRRHSKTGCYFVGRHAQ